MNINSFYAIFAAIVLVTAITISLRKKSKNTKDIVLLFLSIFTILVYTIYKFNLSMDNEFVILAGINEFSWWNELPFNVCNVCMLLFPIVIWKKII